MAGSSLNVPQFISAPDPQGLVQKMLANNILFSMEYRYFDIQFDGKEWIAWFYKRMEPRLLLAKKSKTKGT